MKPDTMGGHLQMLSAFQKAIAGLASYMHAGDTTAMTKQFLDQLGGVPADQLASPDMAEAVVQMVAPTIISIARAVANAPLVLLADEPTGNLDPTTAGYVFDALSALMKQSGLAALIATHNHDLAARMDRRVTLKDGKVVSL